MTLLIEKDPTRDWTFKGKSYKMKVNNKDCIMLSQLYESHEFHVLDFIKIIKNKDTSFSFSVDRNQN